MEIGLPLVWVSIIGFGIFMYVLMDGFVLGIGILFPLSHDEPARDIMMNSVAPVWDGNETWLVLGGTALFAAFPLAYALVLSAFYIPFLVMLFALVLRGVTFELRFKDEAHKPFWNGVFSAGSVVAAFAQGVILGAFVQGLEVVDRQYAGGAFAWLTSFSLVTGLALVAGYALLGATWLVMKTQGELQDWAYRAATVLVIAVMALIGAISLWTPFLANSIQQRWFSFPNIAFLWPVPLLVAASTYGLVRAVQQRREAMPFVLAMSLFLLGYAGLAISLWPNIVPHDISIWQAAAAPSSQSFLLVGTAIIIPIVLLYMGYSYWVFRGKVTGNAGYH